MTYRQFVKWMNDRSADGQWGMTHAMAAVGLLMAMKEQRFWNRRRFWKYMGEAEAKAIVADVERIRNESADEGKGGMNE